MKRRNFIGWVVEHVMLLKAVFNHRSIVNKVTHTENSGIIAL